MDAFDETLYSLSAVIYTGSKSIKQQWSYHVKAPHDPHDAT